MVGSEGIFLISEFEGTSAILVRDIGVLGLVLITFIEFPRLIMCESLKVVRCRCRAKISSLAFLNEVQVA